VSNRLAAGVALGTALLISCKPAPDPADVQRVLDSLLRDHARLFVAGQADSLLAVYTDDPVVYSNHAPPVRGRTDLRVFLEAFTSAGDVRSLEYQTRELAVSGDSAWQIVTYRVSFVPTGATEAVADSGTGFALWLRRPDNVWLIHRDIFNSSVPLPVPAPPPVRR